MRTIVLTTVAIAYSGELKQPAGESVRKLTAGAASGEQEFAGDAIDFNGD
jgi:hypothetical protein